MDKILYLDFDGVLHHHFVLAGEGGAPYYPPEISELGYTLFQYADKLIIPAGISIVLSTSWANNRDSSTNYAKSFLPHHLAKLVVGRTKDIYKGARLFNSLARGAQVRAHISQFRPNKYLALDDDADGFEYFDNKYIQTDSNDGIMPHLDKINDRLAMLAE